MCGTMYIEEVELVYGLLGFLVVFDHRVLTSFFSQLKMGSRREETHPTHTHSLVVVFRIAQLLLPSDLRPIFLVVEAADNSSSSSSLSLTQWTKNGKIVQET